MSETYGFELRELRLCGPAVPPARLAFTKGLNVIEGASDTGKSYAVTCIDFLLGAKDSPEEIPEARGYDVGYLSITAKGGGNHFTLKRALVGGKIGLFQGVIDDAIVADDGDWQTIGVTTRAQKSISGFLLDLCGLAGKRVRSNAYGKTQQVSFRVLAKALIVDEQRIIAKRSPIYGTQRAGDTAAENTIRLLLTGIDDSNIVQPEDRKVAAGRLSGKKEVVEALIVQDKETLHALLDEEAAGPDEQELEELAQILAELSVTSSVALTDLRAAEARRREAWGNRRKSEGRLRDLEGMLSRAGLLKQHYSSDLRRLEAMAESAHVLSHYSKGPCTYCGAAPEHQTHDDIASLQRTIDASRVESVKVHRLMKELEQAIIQMKTEQDEVFAYIEALDAEIEALSLSIENELVPRTRKTTANLRVLQERYGRWVRVSEIRTRLESLQKQLIELEDDGGTKEKVKFVKLTAHTMFGVCKEVSSLLDAWGYVDKPMVGYDEKTADLDIGGRRRVSHGKGVRAVTCAAFVIAIMHYGIKNGLGHPGFVVVDTPLNPYKAADVTDGGAVAPPVKAAFYDHLCTASLGQVVVFENEPAPLDVKKRCNYLHFSGSKIGRQGFIPIGRRKRALIF